MLIGSMGGPVTAQRMTSNALSATGSMEQHVMSETTSEALRLHRAALDVRISLYLDDVPLVDALNAIVDRADLRLAFSRDVLPADARVTVDLRQVPVRRALHEVIDGHRVRLWLTSRGQVVVTRRKDKPVVEALKERVVTTGTLAGTVVDRTGGPLPGANIVVIGTNLGAATDIDGRFRIENVPAGPQQVRVSFLGYQSLVQDIDVAAGETTTLTFTLQEATVEGQELIVYGEATRGQARALNEQKNADNIKNVVAAEQFERFPDRSAADILKRIPGLSVNGGEGENTSVQIRGVSPDLNSVTINGIRASATDAGDGRTAGLNILQADLVQTIRVTKALTPDMDGDAIGGTVDFQLATAPEQPIAKARLSFGVNAQETVRETYDPTVGNVRLSLGQRFLDDRFGVLASGSYFRNGQATYRERRLDYEDEDDVLTDFVERIRPEDRDFIRSRLGGVLSLDYRFDPSHRLFLTSMYSRAWEDQIRRRVDYRVRDVNDAGLITEIRNDMELRNHVEDELARSVELRGDNRFGQVRFTWSGSYSRGEEWQPDRTIYNFRREQEFEQGLAPEAFEQFRFDNSELDPNLQFSLRDIEREDRYHVDQNWIFRGDVELPVLGLGELTTFKTGAKLWTKDKEIENIFFEQDNADDFLVDLDEFGGLEDVRFDDDEYGRLPLESELEVNEDGIQSSYDVNETVTSGYLMATTNWNENISTILGARLEHTDTEYFHVDTPGGATNDYLNVLPSVHIKYGFDEQTNLRLAYTTGLARPRFNDLIPTFEEDNDFDPDDPDNSELVGSIERGNPELEPTTAQNLDLLFESYSSRLGLFSVGLFAKWIENPLGETEFEQTRFNDDIGQDILYTIREPINGETATVFGFEVAFNQRLAFLNIPALAPVGIYANYTFTESDAVYFTGELDRADESFPLILTPQHVANFAISYDNGRTGTLANLAYNYQGIALEAINENETQDVWFRPEHSLDFSFSQSVRGVTVFVEMNNLLNTAERVVFGEPGASFSRFRWHEAYGRSFQLGVLYEL